MDKQFKFKLQFRKEAIIEAPEEWGGISALAHEYQAKRGKLRKALFLDLAIFLGTVPDSTAQHYYSYELINEETRASFGAVHNLYQDSLGRLWLGHYGKGLEIFNGFSIQPVEAGIDFSFAVQQQVFEAARGKLYLNSGRQIHIFDPLQHRVTDSIPVTWQGQEQTVLDYIEVEEATGYLWGIHTLSQDLDTRRQRYQLYFSAGADSLKRIALPPLQTHGEPVIKTFKGGCIVKDTEGLVLLDTFARVQRQLRLPASQLALMTNKTLDIDPQNRLWGYREELPSRDLIVFYIDLADWSVHDFLQIPYEEVTFRDLNEVLAYRREEDLGPFRFDLIRFVDHQLYLAGEVNFIQVDVRTGQQLRINKYILQQKPGVGEFRYVQDLLVDRSGLLFVAMQSGLGKWMQQPDAFHIIPRISTRGFAEDEQGRIYGANGFKVYGPQTGISRYDPRKDTVAWLKLPFFPYWYSVVYKAGWLHFDHKALDWEAGTVESFKDIPYSGNKRAEGTTSHLLVGDQIWTAGWGDDQINIYDSQSLRFQKSIPIPDLEGTLVDLNDMYLRPSDQTVWLGTFGQGVFVFSRAGKLVHHLSIKPESKVVLQNNIVSSFYEDQQGNMWLGHSAGISQVASDFSAIQHFAIDNSRPDYYIIYGILPEETDRFLWLSTNHGLFRFDQQTGLFMDFPLNPKVMEVEYNRTSYLRARNGRLYFGGTDLRSKNVAFYPKEVIEQYLDPEKSKAPIFISQFSRYNGRTNQLTTQNQGGGRMSEIVLQPGDRYFTLEFLLGDLRSPNDHYYSYFLDHYEADWNEAKRHNNLVKYENLPPGKYTLKMRAALMRDHLPLNEYEVKVRVLPYWYQTWLARGLFGLLLAGGLYQIFRYRLKRQVEQREALRLRELDQFKTRLYNNITHEFRTPLTVIQGMNKYIQGFEKEQDLIQRNTDSLLRLVNQMLDLSKLDAGNLQLNMTKGNIIAYIKYLADSFYSLALDKNITLETQYGSPEVIMDFDEEKMQYVFYNLLSNAIKFTPAGGRVTLKIHTPGDRLVIDVADTGRGIPEAAIPHIFDRFYQVQEYTGEQGGTGIGLALTKELIELIGGSIQVKSVLGQGSIFKVSIPILNDTATPSGTLMPAKTATAVKAEARPAFEPAEGSEQPEILIIEDTGAVADYLRLLLVQDYHLRFAADGQAGIDQALEHIPDLIITDVMMPEKNGYQVCQELKQDERTSHIPIIMLTAKADMTSKIKGLEFGADAYLSKPFEQQELFVRLRKLLELRALLQAKYQSYTSSQFIPSSTAGISTEADREKEFLQKLILAIEERLSDADLTIPELSQQLAMSDAQLYRKLKAISGKTPSQFVRTVRLQKAMALLRSSGLNVSEIAYEVGFTSPQYFSRMFKEEFGIPPSEFSAE
jgi:signal transduction histidine kinase/DNA-binding response OmpR family regulator